MIVRLLVTLVALTSLARADVVRVQRGRFVDGKQPFAFVGANVEVMHGGQNRAAFERTLDAVRDDGLRVVRIWALGEGPAGAPDWQRSGDLFRAGPDGWIDAAYQHLDAVLAAAAQRGLRVI